jgi:hypothetical protein
LDLHSTGLCITERTAGIGDGFEIACAEIVAGFCLLDALLRDLDETVGDRKLILGVLTIEERLLALVIARHVRVSGERVELDRLRVR